MGIFEYFFDKSDMTSDYIGCNGEFDCNDEDRAICEEMAGMRACDHDADLEGHFGWENVLNYESDGYGDEAEDCDGGDW